MLGAVGDALAMAFGMFYQTFWALVFGFALSGIVQAMVSKREIAQAMGDAGPISMLRATGLGAASSSCSYAAIAIAKSLFRKGGALAPAMAFMFASTNLVFELGIVIWLLLGWQFTLAEFVGGLVMVLLLWPAVVFLFSDRQVEVARSHDEGGDGHEHQHGSESRIEQLPWNERLRSGQAWSSVSHYFRMDVLMLWKDLVGGFLLAGAIGSWVPSSWWHAVFAPGHGIWSTLLSVFIAPLVAIASFVCSVGNVPLAAVLWGGGVSFAGVVAFIFADLIVLPIVHIYSRYYGWRFALKLTGIFYAVMVGAALVVEAAFTPLGLTHVAHKPVPDSAHIALDYHLALNVLALLILGALFIAARRGSGDQDGSHGPAHTPVDETVSA